MKAVSDLYAPATGTVTESTPDLATAPEKINKDAHGSWMIKVHIEKSERAELAAFRRRLRKIRFRRGRTLGKAKTIPGETQCRQTGIDFAIELMRVTSNIRSLCDIFLSLLLTAKRC